MINPEADCCTLTGVHGWGAYTGQRTSDVFHDNVYNSKATSIVPSTNGQSTRMGVCTRTIEYPVYNRCCTSMTFYYKRTLLQQILDAIGHQYLDLFTNEYTGQLTGDISAVFAYIFDNYAKASQDDVEAQYELVRALTYDLRDPLVTLYTPIDDLQKVAVAAENPFTDTQLVKLALNVLQSTGDFEDTIIAWNARLFPTRTWAAFKPIFDARRNALSKARGKTMQGAGLQQANFLAQALQDNMHCMESTILERLNALKAPGQENPAEENIPPQEQAGNASTDVTTEILQALKNLTANYKKLENKFASISDTPRGGLRDITNTNDRRERRPRTIVTNKYCWTHGGCGHKSGDCKNSGTGHKRDATFASKKGGSTEYCNEA